MKPKKKSTTESTVNFKKKNTEKIKESAPPIPKVTKKRNQKEKKISKEPKGSQESSAPERTIHLFIFEAKRKRL